MRPWLPSVFVGLVALAFPMVARSKSTHVKLPSETPTNELQLVVDPPDCVPVADASTVLVEQGVTSVGQLVGLMARVTCRNIVVAPEIGEVSLDLQAFQPVTVAEFMELVRQALYFRNLVLLDTPQALFVEASNRAVRSPLVPGSATTSKYGFETRIYRIIEGAETLTLVNYLNIFKTTPGGSVHPFPDKNVIVMTEVGRQYDRMEAIMRGLGIKFERLDVSP